VGLFVAVIVNMNATKDWTAFGVTKGRMLPQCQDARRDLKLMFDPAQNRTMLITKDQKPLQKGILASDLN
jgi:hypothetical protein